MHRLHGSDARYLLLVELEHVEAFLAIARSGGFTRGSAVLRLSSPRPAGASSCWRPKLGAPLFDRLGRGVTLTEAAAPSCRTRKRCWPRCGTKSTRSAPCAAPRRHGHARAGRHPGQQQPDRPAGRQPAAHRAWTCGCGPRSPRRSARWCCAATRPGYCGTVPTPTPAGVGHHHRAADPGVPAGASLAAGGGDLATALAGQRWLTFAPCPARPATPTRRRCSSYSPPTGRAAEILPIDSLTAQNA